MEYSIEDDHRFHERKVQSDSYFTQQKLTVDYLDSGCRDLVLRDSKIVKLDPKKIAKLTFIYNNESSAVYCVDNRTTYSVTYTNRKQFFVKNCFFGWSKLSKDDMKNLPKN